MNRRIKPPRMNGFARAEALALTLIVVVLIAILTIATTDTRRRAQLAGSIGNLRQLGTGCGMLGRDFGGPEAP